AYADFVTAMMAFFLVMWIGAQDQKIRQSVANYFVDPSGVTKKPAQTGAVFDSITYGSLPANEKVAMGQGRQSYDRPTEPSPETQVVSKWLPSDEKRFKYWRDQAQRCRDAAVAMGEFKGVSAEEVAVQELANQLRTEVAAGLPTQTSGVYLDLLFGSFNDV